MHANELRQALDTDPDLLDELGLTQKEDAKVHKANPRELAASLALIPSNGQGKTEIGRIAKQTVMACFAGTGEHSSHVPVKLALRILGYDVTRWRRHNGVCKQPVMTYCRYQLSKVANIHGPSVKSGMTRRATRF